MADGHPDEAQACDGAGVSREAPRFCMATANIRCVRSVSASISRYRGSKMNNGSNACGNRMALGSVITGTSRGNFMPQFRATSGFIKTPARGSPAAGGAWGLPKGTPDGMLGNRYEKPNWDHYINRCLSWTRRHADQHQEKGGGTAEDRCQCDLQPVQ
jgi:hypothetical protein